VQETIYIERSGAPAPDRIMFPLWFPTQRHSGAPTVTYRRVVFRLNGCFRCRWVTLDADFGGLKIRVSVVQRHPLATIQIGIPRAKRLLRSQSHDQRVSATNGLDLRSNRSNQCTARWAVQFDSSSGRSRNLAALDAEKSPRRGASILACGAEAYGISAGIRR
jgi:hypothetical protein